MEIMLPRDDLDARVRALYQETLRLRADILDSVRDSNDDDEWEMALDIFETLRVLSNTIKTLRRLVASEKGRACARFFDKLTHAWGWER